MMTHPSPQDHPAPNRTESHRGDPRAWSGRQQWLSRWLWRTGERRALAQFRRAASRIPAYRRILATHPPAEDRIRTIRDFQSRVPIIDKADTFSLFDLPDLCLDGKLGDAATIYTSSGHSGQFAFGLETHADEHRLAKSIDRNLNRYFQIRKFRTLLINALPAGVRVPAGAVTVIDTSTRIDAILACLTHVAKHYQQTLIVAEQPLLKHMVEQGAAQGIDWSAHKLHLITGGEVMPETYRDYLLELLRQPAGEDDLCPLLVSLGVSELGLSLGQETPDSLRIRQAARTDAKLRQTLFGDSGFLPTLVQFDPRQNYIESPLDENERPTLVVTTLDRRRRLPLVRYTTRDWARVIRADDMVAALNQVDRPDLLPRLPLPFVAMWGRGQGLDTAWGMLYPEQIKEKLYADHHVAAAVTGACELGGPREQPVLKVQLQSNHAPSESLQKELAMLMPHCLTIQLVPFHDFTGSLSLNFQRKFTYL